MNDDADADKDEIMTIFDGWMNLDNDDAAWWIVIITINNKNKNNKNNNKEKKKNEKNNLTNLIRVLLTHGRPSP